MSYIPLKNHSMYSILKGLSKPEQMVARAADLGMGAIGITDYLSLGSSVDIIKECKKKGIKPIIGCEIPIFYDGQFGNITVITKNLRGWPTLCDILFQAAPMGKPVEEFTLEKLLENTTQDLIIIDGGAESNLVNHIFLAHENMFDSEDFTNRRLRETKVTYIEPLQAAFGKENVFIGIDFFNHQVAPGLISVADQSRDVAQRFSVKTVMVNSSYYSVPEQYEDHRVCLTIGLKQTMQTIYKRISEGAPQEHKRFFTSAKFYIPEFKEIKDRYKLSEIENTKLISDMCDNIDLKSPQRIPKFSSPNGDSDAHLTQLCRDGWLTKLVIDTPGKRKIYGDRVKLELETIKGALKSTEEYGNLSDYFLIVQDYVRAAHNRGELTGVGRGSGGGCLINYLLGITGIDPLKYDLMFERFYNAGRNTKDNVSLPDIDVDFESLNKYKTIDYLKQKWGEDCVAQICVFGKMKGRSALKDIFRIKTNIGFDRINTITEFVPDESKISDKLQDMLEETGESSIIKWALENNSEELSDYCFINKQGELDGEFAKVFAQAIRLEGTIRSRGRHASGMVISANPLNRICPIWKESKNGDRVTGWEMKALDYAGIPKFDILSIGTLDRLKGIIHSIQERYREGYYT